MVTKTAEKRDFYEAINDRGLIFWMPASRGLFTPGYADQSFCQLNLSGQISFPVYHDPLSLRGTRSMHGLHHGSPAGHGFNKSSNFYSIFRWDAIHAGEIFFDKMSNLLAFQIILAGQCGNKTACQIDCQPGHFKMKPSDVLLADIGQHGIHHKRTRRSLSPFS